MTNAETELGELTITRIFAARPEVVFECMTTPAHLTQFWGPAGASTPLDGIVVELHLSNPDAREPWRRRSVLAPVADGTVAGFGGLGYELAVEAAARLVTDRNRGLPGA